MAEGQLVDKLSIQERLRDIGLNPLRAGVVPYNRIDITFRITSYFVLRNDPNTFELDLVLDTSSVENNGFTMALRSDLGPWVGVIVSIQSIIFV